MASRDEDVVEAASEPELGDGPVEVEEAETRSEHERIRADHAFLCARTTETGGAEPSAGTQLRLPLETSRKHMPAGDLRKVRLSRRSPSTEEQQ